MKRLFWERLAWLWILCIPLAVAGGIGYGGQAYNPQSVAITGGSINNVPIGQTTPRNGAFITLGASSTVSGKGFSDYLASPPTIGGTASGVGNFSTMNTPNSVITGGTIGGTSVAGVAAAGAASPYNPASVAITGGTIGGTSVAGVAAAGAASPYNPASVAITGGTISITGSSAGAQITGVNTANGVGLYGENDLTGIGVYGTNNGTGAGVFGSSVGGYGGQFDKLNTNDHYDLNGKILFSSTAPTIALGFGAGASIVSSSGTAAFEINVGTGGAAINGSVTMPAALNDWICSVAYSLNDAATSTTKEYASTSTLLYFGDFTTSTGASVAWSSGTAFFVTCVPH